MCERASELVVALWTKITSPERDQRSRILSRRISPSGYSKVLLAPTSVPENNKLSKQPSREKSSHNTY